jgi:uncharacterized protein (DUF305 family)
VKSALQQSILAALLVITGCAARGGPEHAAGDARAGAPDAHAAAPDAHAAHHHAHELPVTAGPDFTEADVRFMQAMIVHHAQALTMAVMAPTHGAGDQVVRLAEKIDISQRDEIAMMQRWLAERDQAVPDSAAMHGMHDLHGIAMPGMLTPQQLMQLDAARGREFDRLFLTLMIQHHEGALDMVDELFASPGAGQDPEIFRFATDVETDQRDEIDMMRFMLTLLEANPGGQF